MPIDPSMFGMGGGGGMMGGGPPDPGMMTPGGGQNPMAASALSALDKLQPKSANPTAAIMKMQEAADIAYQLVSTIISQAMSFSPKAVKDAHAIARGLLNLKSALVQESPLGQPPDLSLGMGGAGSPSAMGPQTQSPGMM